MELKFKAGDRVVFTKNTNSDFCKCGDTATFDYYDEQGDPWVIIDEEYANPYLRVCAMHSWLEPVEKKQDETEYLLSSEANVERLMEAVTQSRVKSDGGSSSYYKVQLTLPETLYTKDGQEVTQVVFETQDLVYAFVNGEWSLGNIMKSCRRTALAMQGGGKEGNEVSYDIRKIKWFSEDMLARFCGEKQ